MCWGEGRVSVCEGCVRVRERMQGDGVCMCSGVWRKVCYGVFVEG